MDAQGITRAGRNRILVSMTVLMLAALFFTAYLVVQWGKFSMDKEMERAQNMLASWSALELQTLEMFADVVEEASDLFGNPKDAESFMNSVVKKNANILAASVIPAGTDGEWIVSDGRGFGEEQWNFLQNGSKEAIQAENGRYVSEYYFDADTGYYAVSFFRVLRDQSGNPNAVVALEFSIENLASEIEQSSTEINFSFLLDKEGRILYHPRKDYQAAKDKEIRIQDTDYDGAQNLEGTQCIGEYQTTITAAWEDSDSGLIIVVAAINMIALFGTPFLYGIVYIAILAVTMILLYRIIMKVVLWQDRVSLALQKESEKARQADKAKSTFLAQMSHEIRTPINAVLGMNELILRESHEDAILEYASNAYNSGNALLSIINDVLDISKIEAGKMEITESDYELYTLVRDCYHMTVDRAKKKGLAFLCSVDENLPVELQGDVVHIRQIVVNFITNAIKYSDNGTVELIFAGERTAEGVLLKISVKDTGIGLTEESMKNLFRSFQRFDMQRNQSVEGTGLGLSICKQLAELMGGGVAVESVYGQGSTFSCSVPQKIVKDAPIGKVSVEQRSGGRKLAELAKFTTKAARVLVVDDVEMNLVVFAGLLKGHELEIDTAQSGHKCLEMVTEKKYDIIFMDHQMPGMDGMETFERMNAMEHPNKETPVIMLTANAISGDREKYLAAGFASYLSKPVQGDKLTDMLLSYLPEEKIIWDKSAERTEDASAESRKSAADEDALLDLALGLHYTGEDRNIYQAVLASYVRDGSRRAERIQKLYDKGEWKDYVTEVHALKSTSLTIGSRMLSEMAKELEQAGKKGNYECIHKNNAQMLSVYGKVLSLGQRILDDWKKEQGRAGSGPDHSACASKEELEELTAERLQEYRGKMSDALDEFDVDAILSICEKLSTCTYQGKAPGEHLQKLHEAAEEFDYEQAGEEAEALFAEWLG